VAACGLRLIGWRDGGKPALAAAIVCLACVAPWMAHTRSTTGAFVPPRIGENLFVSTSEWTARVVPRTNVDVLVGLADDLVRDDMRARGITSYNAADRDRALLRHALAYARDHPLETIALKLRNLLFVLQPRLLPFGQRVGEASMAGGRLDVPPVAPRPLAFELAAAIY